MTYTMRSSSQSFDSKMSKTGVGMPKLPQTVHLVNNSMKQAVSVIWNVIPHLKTRFRDVLKKSSHVLLVGIVLSNRLSFGGIHIIEKTLIETLQ